MPGSLNEASAPAFVQFLLRQIRQSLTPIGAVGAPLAAPHIAAQRASESTALLRTLLHTPKWNPVVVLAVDQSLDAMLRACGTVGLKDAVTGVVAIGLPALCVVGGLVEVLRPGGAAWLDSGDDNQAAVGIVAAYSSTASQAKLAVYGADPGACARVRVTGGPVWSCRGATVVDVHTFHAH